MAYQRLPWPANQPLNIMNSFRSSVPLLLYVIIAFSSCSPFEGEVNLRDLSFEVGSEVVWNSDHLSWTLRLSLESGEAGDYIFSYIVDGDPLVRLRSTGGGSVESGREMPLSDRAGATVLLLPQLTSDRAHTLSMEFTREGVSRTYTITLPDTSQKGIGMEVDADPGNDFSTVTLRSLMGPSVTSYNVTFILDGELLSGIKYMGGTFGGSMDIDFSGTESFLFELPYLIAGEHLLRLEVRSSQGSESSQLTFSEPQRRRTALHFYYNDFSGRLMVESAWNPLDTTFEITSDISVEGTVTYRPPQFFGIADPVTEYFTRSGDASSRVTPGVVPAAFDGGRLKALMDEVYSITREDAANAIGNGNRRTLHTDITSVTLRLTVHSEGEYAGKVVVSLSPSSGSGFPIKYTYAEQTHRHAGGTLQTIYPTYTVNGRPPSSTGTL